MKAVLIALSLGFFVSGAQAADSSWMICSDDHLVLNVYEHRVEDSQRAIEFTLIYGMHVMKGQLADENAGVVSLLDDTTADVKEFFGHVAVDYETKTVGLNGELSLHNEVEIVSTTLDCKVMH